MPALLFNVDREHFENEAFRKRCDNHEISQPEVYSKTNPKQPLIVAFLNFSGSCGRITFDTFLE